MSDREIAALGAVMRSAEAATGAAHVKLKEGQVKHEPPFPLAAIRLALLTGMRKAEIIGDLYRGIPALTWDNVDLKAGILLVNHKTETRTGKKRSVYLCSFARQILEGLPRLLGNPHVIPGEKAGQSLTNLQAIWVRIRNQATANSKREAEKAAIKQPAINMADVTIHDLRRTFSSVGARLGYPELWLSALLGHSAGTVTQGYARVAGDPLRVAVEAIGGHIAGLLSGEISPDAENLPGATGGAQA